MLTRDAQLGATAGTLVAVVGELNVQIAGLEATLADRFEQHPDAKVIRSLGEHQGGLANDYDYANGDPVNGFDLDGRRCTRRISWWRCGRGVDDFTAALDKWTAVALGNGRQRSCANGSTCVEHAWTVWPGAYARTEGNTVFFRGSCYCDSHYEKPAYNAG